MNNLNKEICAWENLLQIGSDDYGLRAGVNLAICNFLEGDFTESQKWVLEAERIQAKTLSRFKNEKVYQRYLLSLLKWRADNYTVVVEAKDDKTLYVLGESHSLASHHLRIQHLGNYFFCKAKLIKGCKQWHLGNSYRNQFKKQFENIFYSLPKYSHVLLAIGEIDCRLDGGIIEHKSKYPKKQIERIILDTIGNYLSYIIAKNSRCQHKIIIQGVPCPNIDINNHANNKINQLVEVINTFNYELKAQSKEKGFGFLDTHQITDTGTGLSNSEWHIDDYHLSPDGMLEVWRRHTAEKS